jgi:cupin fold WbuC family metalloprotein
MCSVDAMTTPRLGTLPVARQNEEVLYAAEQVVKVSRGDVHLLKKLSLATQRRRIRLCAHRDIEDRLHEMLIVHLEETYIRPHKHLGKSESFHLIEGLVDVVVFDDAGAITQVIEMGDYASGRHFYYRLADPLYHTLVIRSEFVVFHESTTGPFNRSDIIFAEWAPEETAIPERTRFQRELAEKVGQFQSARRVHTSGVDG